MADKFLLGDGTSRILLGDGTSFLTLGEASAGIPRGPVIVRRIARMWPMPVQQHNLLTATLAPVAMPFAPAAWPVPRGYSQVRYGYAQAGIMQPPVVPSMPANPVRRADDVRLRTWLQSLVTTTLAPTGVPFAPVAFPNPVRRVSAALTWTQSPQPTPSDTETVLRAPAFAPRITRKTLLTGPFPNPLALQDAGGVPPDTENVPAWVGIGMLPQRRHNPALYSWTQSPAVPTAAAPTPFLGATFPNPTLRRLGAQTWTQSPAVPASADALPFVQSTTQNPVLRRAEVSNRTWIQAPPGPDSVAPAFAGWINPVLRRGTPVNLTWTQSLSLPANVGVGNPFTPVMFENPVRRRERFDMRTWLQSLSLPQNVPPGTPFAQTDWANPVRRKDNPDLRFWAYSTQNTAMTDPRVQPEPVPGGAHWPPMRWMLYRRLEQLQDEEERRRAKRRVASPAPAPVEAKDPQASVGPSIEETLLDAAEVYLAQIEARQEDPIDIEALTLRDMRAIRRLRAEAIEQQNAAFLLLLA